MDFTGIEELRRQTCQHTKVNKAKPSLFFGIPDAERNMWPAVRTPYYALFYQYRILNLTIF